MEEIVATVLEYAAPIAAGDWIFAATFLLLAVLASRSLRHIAERFAALRYRRRRNAATAAKADAPETAAPDAPARAAPARAVAPVPQRVDRGQPEKVAEALRKVRFAPKSMMGWQEYCLLRDLEGLLAQMNAGHRVFCHVALSEFFDAEPGRAGPELGEAVARAMAPYRADFLVVDRQGYPVLGIAFAQRDPVLHAVMAGAGLSCLNVSEDYAWPALESELRTHLAPGRTDSRLLRKTA